MSDKNFKFLILALLFVTVGLFLCFLYIAYTFYNMTHDGLINVLTIFGLSILFDFFVLRFIVISLISVYTTR